MKIWSSDGSGNGGAVMVMTGEGEVVTASMERLRDCMDKISNYG